MKVASYCRVSTEKEDQANSFETQKRFFRDYISNQPDWELFEIYADEGITGTSTKKRTQFNRMISDAYEGKFQLILTKEVSRFSRNILDTIAYTRELKAIGIGVLFLTDRINTLQPESEMLLSFLASLAQEESRRTSERVVWGQTRQMEKGVVFGRSLLGYDVKGGKITIDPMGAEIVRKIFHMYAIEQIGASKIAAYLTKEGCRTSRGSTVWHANTVIKILKNEKYAGDLIQKKTYTPDYLTHEKCRNTGAVPLICLKDHHAAIVDREIWNLTQERLRIRNKHGGTGSGYSNRYVFSGRIKCGECGASFVGRFWYSGKEEKLRRWSCGTVAREGAAACMVGRLVRDDDAIAMLKTALQCLRIDKKGIIAEVTKLAWDAIQSEKIRTTDDPVQLKVELERIRHKKSAALDSYFSGDIGREDMLSLKNSYETQTALLEKKLKDAEKSIHHDADMQLLQTQITSTLEDLLDGKTENDVFYKNILHSLTVYRNRTIELKLQHLSQIFRFYG